MSGSSSSSAAAAVTDQGKVMPAHGQQLSSCSLSSTSPGNRPDGGKIRVEFAVNINNQSDLQRIDEALKRKGVSLVSSDLDGRIIQLDVPRDHNNAGHLMENAHSLQRFIEEQTGLLTVVKGLGELSSAVAELRPPIKIESKGQEHIMGVVRLSQLEDSQCYVDGAIEGLSGLKSTGNRYSLAIHEYGDLGGVGYANIGGPLVHIQETESSKDGDTFSVINRTIPKCDVASMIGRSIAVTRFDTSSNKSTEKQVLSAGVIARASTIGANKKQICSCSGKTLWEERLDKKQTTG